MARRFSGALVVGGLILGLAGVSAVGSAAPELPIRGASVTGFDYLVSINLPAAASERGVVAPPPPQAEPAPGTAATPALEESSEPEPRATPGPEPRPRPSVGPTPPARPTPSQEAN